jgi:membrane associated rhomboid family serine protease
MRLSGRESTPLIQPWTARQRLALVVLIGVNTAAFVTQLLLQTQQADFVRDYLGLSDAGVRSAYAWQFLSAIFLHRTVLHFAAATIVLYLIGRDVESILGQRSFLLLYIFGSVAGEMSHLFIMPSATVLFGGCGGAVAVLFAYATILPELEFTFLPIFLRPLRLKAKYLAYTVVAGALVLLFFARNGVVGHSALLGGCLAGWLYAHLLGFGRPSFLQRSLHQRRAAVARLREMTAQEFIAEEVDPLLEKISRSGLQSLSRRERKILAKAREKMAAQTAVH